MPLHKLSQKSFVNGQYDRTAQNQESVSGGGVVASGLSYAKNVLSSDKGELRKRLGTRFLKQLNDATVIVPFRNKDKDDILLFSPNKLDVLEYVEGQVGSVENYQQGTDTKVEKTWTSNTVDGYTVSVPTRGTSGNAAFNMFQDPHYPFSTPSEAVDYPFVGGYEYLGDTAGGGIYPPNQFFMKMQLPNGGIVGKFSVIFATTHNRGDVPTESGYTGYTNAVIQYSDDNNIWTSVNTVISSTAGNTPYYVWRFKSVRNGNVVTIDTRYIENIIMYDVILNDNVDNHRYWRVLFSNPVDSHDRLYSQKLNIQFYTRSLTPYSTITTDITELKNIKYAQNGNDMKLTDGEHNPKTITLGAGYSCSDYIPTSPNTLWTDLGKPSCVEYFQNRLWWGGFDAFPNRVIASKFNQINYYTTNTPAQVDDALDLSCNQLKSPITNLKGGQKVMYCFSEDGISNIDGGSTGMLATNQNIEFILKNRMPAGSSTPGFKDDVMLYSSSDGTKLYGVDFDLLVNRFQVSDLAKYAKDITKAKITELHYVNNESKLVYGLTEEGFMFALLYEKGQYQGFFPMDFNGTVYDIAPIKVGRDYKLLMVVFRDGNWYLEEKLDVGKYIDTSTPRLTSEEKKWATYDNLENNIALDCYQTYDLSFDANIQIVSENRVDSNIDLSSYINKTLMFKNEDSEDFVICSIYNSELQSKWTPFAVNENLSTMRNISGLIYANNQFIAIGSLQYVYISTSSDGVNWETPTQISSMEWHGADSIAYNGSLYVLIGDDRITTSTDLITWTTPVYDANMSSHRWLCLTYKSGNFIAISTDGYISTSSNGTTWTTPTANANLGNDKVWRSIATNGSKFVLLGNEGYISTSTDGTTWTAATQPTVLFNSSYNQTWRSISYDGTKFIVLSVDGSFSTSTDGVTWTLPIKDANLGNNAWLLLSYGNSNLIALNATGGLSNNESSSIVENYYKNTVQIETQRGNTTSFTKTYPEFTTFQPNLPSSASIGVISEGRYFNAQVPDSDGYITLPVPCHKVIYGVNYEALAILKIQTPYESMKQVAQVDVSVIDTTHLEIGTDFSDTQNIEKIDDSSYYDLTRITMNDTYRIVVSDTPEMTKNVILRSNKGVPFTVNAVDVYVNYSNLGGD